MEFEHIQLEYGSNIEEAVEHKLKHQIVAKKPKSYSSIRASRMELVSTPNVRLFNDDRKTVMDHSSRPISGKCLKDARNIYSAVSRNGNNHIVTNCAGHISESALAKRRSIMESINAIISSQGSISNLSYTKNIDFMNQNDLKVEFELLNQSKVSNEQTTRSFKIKKMPTNLKETKQYLRDQLKEIREAGGQIVSTNDSIETKSCLNGINSNRFTNMFAEMSKPVIELNGMRPTSSPSRVDTRTKIRMKYEDRRRLQNQIVASEVYEN